MEKPLVSVCVVTYNSAEYILETLESIKVQTYPNIELIVSDDCSTDETVEVCRKWIEKNLTRFIHAKLISSDVNTGVSANCNRGYSIAQGEWIKGIAGDDILFPDCIAQFFELYDGIDDIVGGMMQGFYTNAANEKCYIKQTIPYYSAMIKYKMSTEQQLHHILRANFVAAPTVFMRKEIWERMGGFDENYKMMEDYPFWVKCLSKGYRIGFIDSLVVYYRFGNSLTSSTESFYNLKYYNSLVAFKKEVIYPQIPILDIIYWQNELIESIRYVVLCKWFSNRKSTFSSFINTLIYNMSIMCQIVRIQNTKAKLKFG